MKTQAICFPSYRVGEQKLLLTVSMGHLDAIKTRGKFQIQLILLPHSEVPAQLHGCRYRPGWYRLH